MSEAKRQPRFGVVFASAVTAAIASGVLAGDEEVGAMVGVVVLALGASFDAVRTGAAATNPGPLYRESRPVLFWVVVTGWFSVGVIMFAALLID